jgi:hypothetical protein
MAKNQVVSHFEFVKIIDLKITNHTTSKAISPANKQIGG